MSCCKCLKNVMKDITEVFKYYFRHHSRITQEKLNHASPSVETLYLNMTTKTLIFRKKYLHIRERRQLSPPMISEFIRINLTFIPSEIISKP